jgi:hypothetical protein
MRLAPPDRMSHREKDPGEKLGLTKVTDSVSETQFPP